MIGGYDIAGALVYVLNQNGAVAGKNLYILTIWVAIWVAKYIMGAFGISWMKKAPLSLSDQISFHTVRIGVAPLLHCT